jgi:anti-sigma-K factor RskA
VDSIVDEFVAGQLAGEAASAAERLVRENAFAAERVMERRLLQQAESSPTLSHALSEKILKEAERAAARRSPIKRPFGAALLSWKIAGVAAVAGVAMVLGGGLL